MNIVFFQPEIPHNTGNMGRTCVLTGATLHLIKPYGFSIDEKQIRRTGLDYWKDVKLKEWNTLEELIEAYPNSNFYFATTKTKQRYSDVSYTKDDFVVFGPESRGIPVEILEKYKANNITIPMKPQGRSLNLSTSAAIVLYEALRQLDFELED
ncbi:MAG: tRNA (cytidine(34)-2'-O)-methyltransferase [Fusobacteriaceae bacterium]|jgi:tRNA (cytidine/uridine-2'-O-)-methyltransferase|nr:tRNA (cytidine(34)-2'-O)-methyltransferase [Fusobacteriaceae bacterium]MBP6468038.1 tRNA (cytidine(34)-2'-O)-methyltransferase [Fusobacteriaceae bacterium]MBP9596782.1 tRNA (cytidine(34)-2'-O)-methyltransferase [Fusobacteriaceae bacterium]